MYNMFTDATTKEINETLKEAWDAFHRYRKMPLKATADFMLAVGKELKIMTMN